MTSPGWDFDVGTAVCFRCSSMDLSFAQNAGGFALCFVAAAAGVRVYFDCTFLADDAGPDAAALGGLLEGEVLLF